MKYFHLAVGTRDR